MLLFVGEMQYFLINMLIPIWENCFIYVSI